MSDEPNEPNEPNGLGSAEPNAQRESGPGPVGVSGQDSPPSSAQFMRWGLLFYGAMALAAVLWRVGFFAEDLLYAGPVAEARGLEPLRDVGVGVAAGIGVLVLSQLLTRFTGWGERMARSLGEALTPLSVPDAVLIAFASGLAEEMLFRGALQPRVGWIAASLMFGALHFAPRRELVPWTVFAVAAGGLFGWLFEWTGNLIAPVIAHTLVNAVNLPLLMREHAHTPSVSSAERPR